MKTLPQMKSVVCPHCHTDAKWVEHGPTVGRGWYCPGCKDDVIHVDNVYGVTGGRIMQQNTFTRVPPAAPVGVKSAVPTVTRPSPAAAPSGAYTPPLGVAPNHPHAPARSLGYNGTFLALDCSKPGCKNCVGIKGAPVAISAGDFVVCTSDLGCRAWLNHGSVYSVAEILAFTIKVWCVEKTTGRLVAREYTRCRFGKI
jgi:hypothetical protein